LNDADLPPHWSHPGSIWHTQARSTEPRAPASPTRVPNDVHHRTPPAPLGNSPAPRRTAIAWPY
jgi:hypothetical protein